MPSLEDVKATLVKTEGGQALYEVVADALASAKNDRRSEVETLKTQNSSFLSVLKDIGYNPEQPDPNFPKTLKEQLEKGKGDGEKLTGTEKRLRDLEVANSDLSKKFTDSEARATKAEAAKKMAIAKDLLVNKLKGKIYGATARVENLILTGEVGLSPDEKSLVWKNADDFDKGLNSYLDANKEDLVNGQSAGPGAGNRGGGQPAGKTMPRSDFEALSPADQYKFAVTDGGKIV